MTDEEARLRPPHRGAADPFADTALLPATMNEPHHDRR